MDQFSASLGCGKSSPVAVFDAAKTTSKASQERSCSANSSSKNKTRDGEYQKMLGTGINVSTTSVGPVAGKRPKVALQPGRSLMDWIRLGASGKDIQGFGGKKMTVTMEELAKHDKIDDCWMLLRGKIHNDVKRVCNEFSETNPLKYR